MIARSSHLAIARLPLSALCVHEYEQRHPERVLHYVRIMTAHPTSDPGLISVKPSGEGRYEVLDGHHRYCAAILTGRSTLLCLVIREE